MKGKVKVLYTAHARKDLRRLDDTDSKRVVLAVEKKTADNPLGGAKLLHGSLHGLYRYRVGDYRVIFQYEKGKILHIITIVRVKHRKDAYT